MKKDKVEPKDVLTPWELELYEKAMAMYKEEAKQDTDIEIKKVRSVTIPIPRFTGSVKIRLSSREMR